MRAEWCGKAMSGDKEAKGGKGLLEVRITMLEVSEQSPSPQGGVEG